MTTLAHATDLANPILPSRSIAATVDFYQRLGFEGGVHHADAGCYLLRVGQILGGGQ